MSRVHEQNKHARISALNCHSVMLFGWPSPAWIATVFTRFSRALKPNGVIYLMGGDVAVAQAAVNEMFANHHLTVTCKKCTKTQTFSGCQEGRRGPGGQGRRLGV